MRSYSGLIGELDDLAPTWKQRKTSWINWLHAKLFPCKDRELRELKRKYIQLLGEKEALEKKLRYGWS